MGKHNEFGKEGEQIAVDFLIKNGYKILCRNYRFLKSEIDILAKKEDVLAVVEVRARSNDRVISIADTITTKKIKLLVAGAHQYIIDNELDVEARFDVITILKNKKIFKIEHLESAFYHF
ncbi:YraN family protein [Aurantibacter crassamenti]|uniref:YraN family protein n=1 Tax=Aurantibacter crassamenti TaxID=1837375 RepID=UPI001939C527|nr:YraN family protein [Aurantibacter crassamenti]MBM1105548.1 YraN family protein [Aurantibacter crassamenti]